jgi:hypothetical protein
VLASLADAIASAVLSLVLRVNQKGLDADNRSSRRQSSATLRRSGLTGCRNLNLCDLEFEVDWRRDVWMRVRGEVRRSVAAGPPEGSRDALKKRHPVSSTSARMSCSAHRAVFRYTPFGKPKFSDGRSKLSVKKQNLPITYLKLNTTPS